MLDQSRSLFCVTDPREKIIVVENVSVLGKESKDQPLDEMVHVLVAGCPRHHMTKTLPALLSASH